MRVDFDAIRRENRALSTPDDGTASTLAKGEFLADCNLGEIRAVGRAELGPETYVEFNKVAITDPNDPFSLGDQSDGFTADKSCRC